MGVSEAALDSYTMEGWARYSAQLLTVEDLPADPNRWPSPRRHSLTGDSPVNRN